MVQCEPTSIVMSRELIQTQSSSKVLVEAGTLKEWLKMMGNGRDHKDYVLFVLTKM